MRNPTITPRRAAAPGLASGLLGAVLSAGLAPAAQATPESLDSALVYVQADAAHHAQRVVRGPQSATVANQAQRSDQAETTLATATLPPNCEISDQAAAPHGQWVAQQVNCEDNGFVQVINAASGEIKDGTAGLGPDSLFLNWLPNGQELAVKVDVIGTARVYVVNVAGGKAEVLPVPPTTYDVTFSRNGQQMLYALTQGLGYGSELWLADTNGQNARRVLADPTHILAYARWSPAGDALAYLRMPDSNIPFTVGELWAADGEGNQAVWLGAADAGHGYAPAWSPDGAQIAFVGRDNQADVAADQDADRLVSNIYVADVKGRRVDNLTGFSGALAESPAWSPDGAALAFSANAGGQGMDTWTYDVKGRRAAQVTHGANARHPVWLKNPGGLTPQRLGTPAGVTPAATETFTPTVAPATLAPSETASATVTPTLTVTETLTPTVVPPTLVPSETASATATLTATETLIPTVALPTQTPSETAAAPATLAPPTTTLTPTETVTPPVATTAPPLALTPTPTATLTLTLALPTATLAPITATVTLTR